MKSLFDTEIERQYGKVEYQFDGETIARHRTRMESASEIRKLDRLLGKDGKWYPRSVERAKSTTPEVITLEAWKAMDSRTRKAALNAPACDAKFNRQDNESIEWAQWSWNPITGCLHGCSYCTKRPKPKENKP